MIPKPGPLGHVQAISAQAANQHHRCLIWERGYKSLLLCATCTGGLRS